MIGRGREAARLEELIGAATRGGSGALLITGEAGIGKTTLLHHARTLAGSDAHVLVAGGVEAESHLPFAGLAYLLGPVLPLIGVLPEPQADAIRGALALGPPIPGDRFTTYAATFGLLAAAAEEQPVVCFVDDAQWLDTESLEALLFTAARLGVEGIALAIAARPGTNPRVDGSPLERLPLQPLDADDAAQLLRRHASEAPAPETLDAAVAGAGGNPLAIVELATVLTPDQLAGRAPLPDPLPVGPHLSRGLLRPMSGLPESTRRALLIVSASDGALGHVDRALTAGALGLEDLAVAADAGILTVGPDHVTFSHPLVRAAVYSDAPAAERRAAHRINADAAAEVQDEDRRAWHLALAATGPDDEVADALEGSAGRAAARAAYAAATDALGAAARLSPEPTSRGRRLIAGGRNAMAAGDFTRAAEALDEVIALGADPEQVVAASTMRGFAEAWGGSARRAIDMLVAAADRIAGPAPAAAAFLLVQAVPPCHMRADLPLARTLVERALRLSDGAPPDIRAYTDMAVTATRVSSGEGVDVAADTEAAIAGLAATGDPIAQIWAGLVGYVRLHTERYGQASAAFAAAVDVGRSRNTPSLLPHALTTSAELHGRLGRFDDALAEASEAAELAAATGQAGARGFALGVLAHVEAVLGRDDDCVRHADECLDGIERSEADVLRIYSSAAKGLLALGRGDLTTAEGHLEDARRRSLPFHPVNPLLVAWAQDLVETRIRLGAASEADAGLGELEAMAGQGDLPSPKAAVARCRGLLPDAAFEDHFARALSLHDRAGRPFERARTLLCLGERRRRIRQTSAAREPLADALSEFERMGAAPWADRARSELRAAGGEATSASTGLATMLTPQELQVTLRVARGDTTREAAVALMISGKTVEAHLARVYAKLGVRSRAELATLVAQRQEPHTAREDGTGPAR